MNCCTVIRAFFSHTPSISPVDEHPDLVKNAPSNKVYVENELYCFLKDLTNVSNNLTKSEISAEIFNLITNNGADINYQSEHKDTALLKSCMLGDESVFKQLIGLGAEITENKFGHTVVHTAAYHNNLDVLEYFLKENENKTKYLEARTYVEDQTPLHYAAKKGYLQIVNFLVRECKANMEARDHQGRTVLYLAAEYGQKEIVEYLIKNNAEIDVVNIYGQKALYWIVAKNPELASNVLDRYMERNNYSKRDVYHLKYIEPEPLRNNTIPHAKTILSHIVENKQLDLIVHPVINQLIRVKWKEFGRMPCYFDLAFTFSYVTIWNLLGAFISYDQRYKYVFPQDWWRLTLFILGIIGAFYLILVEFKELRTEVKYQKKCQEHRFQELESDVQFCHYNYQNSEFITQEKSTFKKSQIILSYFKNPWNWFDLIVICLITATICSHIVDVVDHTDYKARVHIRILAITIIFISARLLKVGRVINEQFGILVITLTSIYADVIVWLVIFIAAWIPFTSAFWMLYGGIEKLETYQKTSFILYLITFGSDFDNERENMKKVDDEFTDPLLGFYIGTTSLVLINIFIGLLTATFNYVHDSSQAQLLLSRASEVLVIEHKMKEKKHYKHLKRLKNSSVGKMNLQTESETEYRFNSMEPVKENIDSACEKSEKLEQQLWRIMEDYDTCWNELQELKSLVQVLIRKKQSTHIHGTMVLEREPPHVDVLQLDDIDMGNQNDGEETVFVNPLNSNYN